MRWVFEQRADGRGWTAIARELADRGVRQHNGPAAESAHAAADGRPPRVSRGGSSRRARPSRTRTRRSSTRSCSRPPTGSSRQRRRRAAARSTCWSGLPRCAGCSYALKPQLQRSGDYRWLCRTLLSERSATHECPAPALIRASEHRSSSGWWWTRPRRSRPMSAPRPPTIRSSRPRSAHGRTRSGCWTSSSSLEERELLGPERWGRLVREARARVDEATIAEARARGRERVDQRVWLADAWEQLDPAEQRDELRSLVRCVMVHAGDAPLADRVHVLGPDDPVELPRQGVPGVARTLESAGSAASCRRGGALATARGSGRPAVARAGARASLIRTAPPPAGEPRRPTRSSARCHSRASRHRGGRTPG